MKRHLKRKVTLEEQAGTGSYCEKLSKFSCMFHTGSTSEIRHLNFYADMLFSCLFTLPRSSFLLKIASANASVLTTKPRMNMGIKFHRQPLVTFKWLSISLLSFPFANGNSNTAANQFSGVHSSLGYGTIFGYGLLFSDAAKSASICWPEWLLVMRKVYINAASVSSIEKTDIATQK